MDESEKSLILEASRSDVAKTTAVPITVTTIIGRRRNESMRLNKAVESISNVPGLNNRAIDLSRKESISVTANGIPLLNLDGLICDVARLKLKKLKGHLSDLEKSQYPDITPASHSARVGHDDNENREQSTAPIESQTSRGLHRKFGRPPAFDKRLSYRTGVEFFETSEEADFIRYKRSFVKGDISQIVKDEIFTPSQPILESYVPKDGLQQFEVKYLKDLPQYSNIQARALEHSQKSQDGQHTYRNRNINAPTKTDSLSNQPIYLSKDIAELESSLFLNQSNDDVQILSDVLDHSNETLYKNLNETAHTSPSILTIDVSHKQLGDQYSFLYFNTAISNYQNSRDERPLNINIRNNRISEHGTMKLLGELEGVRNQLYMLDISENKLVAQSFGEVMKIVKESKSLKKLTLEKCSLSDAALRLLVSPDLGFGKFIPVAPIKTKANKKPAKGKSRKDKEQAFVAAPVVQQSLSSSSDFHLISLNLSGNKIGDSGASSVAGALYSLPLTDLNISWNEIKIAGAVALANAVSVHPALGTLNLSWNAFGSHNRSVDDREASSAKALANMLAANKVLVHLDVSNSQLSASDCAVIGEGLKLNRTLMGIHITMNEGKVDAYGHLLPEAEAWPLDTAHLAMTRITTDSKLSNVVDRERWTLRSKCWLCGYWQEYHFLYMLSRRDINQMRNAPLQTPIASIDKYPDFLERNVRLCTSFDGWITESMFSLQRIEQEEAKKNKGTKKIRNRDIARYFQSKASYKEILSDEDILSIFTSCGSESVRSYNIGGRKIVKYFKPVVEKPKQLSFRNQKRLQQSSHPKSGQISEKESKSRLKLATHAEVSHVDDSYSDTDSDASVLASDDNNPDHQDGVDKTNLVDEIGDTATAVNPILIEELEDDEFQRPVFELFRMVPPGIHFYAYELEGSEGALIFDPYQPYCGTEELIQMGYKFPPHVQPPEYINIIRMKELSEEAKLRGYQSVVSEVAQPRIKNSDYIREKIWKVPDSIFAPDFFRNSRVFALKCFEADWKHCVKGTKLSDAELKDAVKAVYVKHYQLIAAVYCHYCCLYSTENFFMGMGSFNEFVQACGIMDSFGGSGPGPGPSTNAVYSNRPAMDADDLHPNQCAAESSTLLEKVILSEVGNEEVPAPIDTPLVVNVIVNLKRQSDRSKSTVVKAVDLSQEKGCTRIEVDMAFISNTITGPKHLNNGKRFLNRFQFMDCLFVLAQVKFLKTKKVENIALSLEKLLSDYVEPNADREKTLKFRTDILLTEVVDVAIRNNIEYFTQIFKRHCGEENIPSESKTMSMKEWNDALQSMKIPVDVIGDRPVKLSYCRSKILIVDCFNYDYVPQNRMQYLEFLEAVVRISLYMCQYEEFERTKVPEISPPRTADYELPPVDEGAVTAASDDHGDAGNSLAAVSSSSVAPQPPKSGSVNPASLRRNGVKDGLHQDSQGQRRQSFRGSVAAVDVDPKKWSGASDKKLGVGAIELVEVKAQIVAEYIQKMSSSALRRLL